MAKKLNTTVHLTDEKGQTQVFGPKDELPGWAEKQLSESWGDDRDDLWGEADSRNPEEIPVKEALEGGTPPPDRGPVEQDEPTARDAEAIALGQEAREAEADTADAEDGEVKPRGRRK